MISTDIRLILLYEYKLGNNAEKAGRYINKTFGEKSVSNRKGRIKNFGLVFFPAK